MEYKLTRLILSLIIFVAVTEAKTRSVRLRKRQGLKVKQNLVNGQHIVDSLMACGGLCAQEQCTTFSWHEGSGKCMLVSIALPYMGKVAGHYYEIPGWMSFNRRVMPVFEANLGALFGFTRHVKSLDEAKDLCRKMGSQIAGRQDMIDTMDEGFHLCVCGWYENGIATIVQHFDFACMPYIGNKFPRCSLPSSTQVWCKA